MLQHEFARRAVDRLAKDVGAESIAELFVHSVRAAERVERLLDQPQAEREVGEGDFQAGRRRFMVATLQAGARGRTWAGGRSRRPLWRNWGAGSWRSTARTTSIDCCGRRSSERH